MLLVLPCYYIYSGNLTTLTIEKETKSTSFLKWWLLSCALFAIYYYTAVTPIAIVTGLNLNYMLSPPPLPVDWVQGNSYRLLSTVICAFAFFVMRLFVTIIEVVSRNAVSSAFNPYTTEKKLQ